METAEKKVVLITGSVQKEIVPALAPYFNVRQWRGDGVMPLTELEKQIGSADALMLAYHSKLPAAVIAQGKQLHLIVQHFVGYEDVDIAACTQYGIPFCNTASASVHTVAELAMALMFASSRHIVDCAGYVKNGGWRRREKYDFLYGFDIQGSLLGVLGMGKIGYAIAQKAQGLGMKVLYHNRHRRCELESNMLQYAALPELYRQADVIINVLPSNADTYHSVALASFRQMKHTALFINIGRGDTVVTADLITALQMGEIGGAALDVAEQEPLPADHPLLQLSNVIITPHIGSDTEKTRQRKSAIAIQNIFNCFSGKPLIDCVNPEVWHS